MSDYEVLRGTCISCGQEDRRVIQVRCTFLCSTCMREMALVIEAIAQGEAAAKANLPASTLRVYAVMRKMYRESGGHPMKFIEIAKVAGRAKGVIHMHVERLVAAGLAMHVPNRKARSIYLVPEPEVGWRDSK